MTRQLQSCLPLHTELLCVPALPSPYLGIKTPWKTMSLRAFSNTCQLDWRAQIFLWHMNYWNGPAAVASPPQLPHVWSCSNHVRCYVMHCYYHCWFQVAMETAICEADAGIGHWLVWDGSCKQLTNTEVSFIWVTKYFGTLHVLMYNYTCRVLHIYI